MVVVYLKLCNKCQGDLILEGDEWRCFQCGTYYYPLNTEPIPDPDSNEADFHVNARIRIQERTKNKWWERNEEVVKYLDAGMSIREIAKKVGKTEQTIRRIKVDLEGYRSLNEP